MIRELKDTKISQKRDITPVYGTGQTDFGKPVTFEDNPNNPTPFELKINLHLAYSQDEHELIHSILEPITMVIQRMNEARAAMDIIDIHVIRQLEIPGRGVVLTVDDDKRFEIGSTVRDGSWVWKVQGIERCGAGGSVGLVVTPDEGHRPFKDCSCCPPEES